MDSTNWVSSIADVVMALGIVLVFWQAVLLRQQISADHERSRREMTVTLLQHWNGAITPLTAAAERLVRKFDDDQCQKLADGRELQIKAEHRSLVETCLADVLSLGESVPEASGMLNLTQKHVSRLRWQVADYLNETEALLLGWQVSIADRKMIEREFAFLYEPEKGTDALAKFRTAMGGRGCFPAIYDFMLMLHEQRKGEPQARPPVA
jgi:hypothetical protein